MSSSWIVKTKRHSIYDRDNHTCTYCSIPVVAGASTRLDAATLDHIKSRNKGGSNKAKNLVTCCLQCNSSKNDDTFVVFAQRLSTRLAVEINSRDLYSKAVRHSKRSIVKHWAKRKLEAKLAAK